ncbi:MAG: DUF342 domain-containing protein [Thermotogota bacterium]
MKWEFEAKDMEEVFEQMEKRYGEAWDEKYSIKTEYNHSGLINVHITPISSGSVNWDTVKEMVEKDIILDDDELTSTVDEVMSTFNSVKISVSISEDAMNAYLTVYPGSLKERLSEDVLYEVLKNENIIYGIKKEKLKKLCSFIITEPFEKILIAEGKHPTKSSDAKIEYLFPADGFITVNQSENKNVDFSKRKQIFQCKKGDLLVKKTPGIQGMDGMTVTGKKIPAKQYKDINLPQLIGNKQTLTLSEDGMGIVALADGQPYLTNLGKIHIRKVFIVNHNLDYSVGDIEFDGTVIVHGDVEVPFQVHAKGDIFIDGVVRDTFISGESNIVINGGVSGSGRGRVECQKDLTVSFLNNVTVIVDCNCISKDYILNSVVYAGENIVIHGRGTVAGGSLLAGNKTAVKIAGSPGGVRTLLVAGINYQRRKEDVKRNLKISDLLHKAGLLSTAMARLYEQLKTIDSKDKQLELTNLLAKIKLTKKKYMTMIKNIREAPYSKEAENPHRKGRKIIPSISVSEHAYLGVHIQIYSEFVKLPSEIGPTEFRYSFDDKKLKARPIGKWKMNM